MYSCVAIPETLPAGLMAGVSVIQHSQVLTIFMYSTDTKLWSHSMVDYLTRAVSSPTSDPGKPVLFGYVRLSICPSVRLSGLVQRMCWTNSVANFSAVYH